MRWAEITVSCATDAADAVSYAFVQAGCGGVMLTGNGPVVIQGSLPVSDELTPRLTELQQHLDRFEEFGLPPLCDRITLRFAEDEDWADAWKKYFPNHFILEIASGCQAELGAVRSSAG